MLVRSVNLTQIIIIIIRINGEFMVMAIFIILFLKINNILILVILAHRRYLRIYAVWAPILS